MRVTSRQFAISLTLIAVTFFSSSALAAQPSPGATQPLGDWSSINSVPKGDRVSVRMKNGQTIDGKLNGFSDDGLSLIVKGKAVAVKREEVSSVYHLIRKSAAKATLIGLGIGAGAGAAVGLAGSSNDNGFDKIDHAVTAGLAVLGGGAGALAGYLIGRSSRKRVLIYQAP